MNTEIELPRLLIARPGQPPEVVSPRNRLSIEGMRTQTIAGPQRPDNIDIDGKIRREVGDQLCCLMVPALVVLAAFTIHSLGKNAEHEVQINELERQLESLKEDVLLPKEEEKESSEQG